MSKKQKKVIGFDLDGVIIDHTNLKIKLAKERGFILRPEETASDIFGNFIPKSQVQEIQYYLYDDLKTAFLSPLMAGAKEGLKQIKSVKIPYFLISRRKNAPIAVEILKHHELWPKYFNEDNVFFVETKEDKNKKSVACGVTDYIDDEISVLKKLTSVKNKFLFDKFNIATINGNFVKVSSWEELMKFI